MVCGACSPFEASLIGREGGREGGRQRVCQTCHLALGKGGGNTIGDGVRRGGLEGKERSGEATRQAARRKRQVSR